MLHQTFNFQLSNVLFIICFFLLNRSLVSSRITCSHKLSTTHTEKCRCSLSLNFSPLFLRGNLCFSYLLCCLCSYYNPIIFFTMPFTRQTLSFISLNHYRIILRHLSEHLTHHHLRVLLMSDYTCLLGRSIEPSHAGLPVVDHYQ